MSCSFSSAACSRRSERILHVHRYPLLLTDDTRVHVQRCSTCESKSLTTYYDDVLEEAHVISSAWFVITRQVDNVRSIV